MKIPVLIFAGLISSSILSTAQAGDGHTMMESCKTECPDAKTEDEAHRCMKGVAKKKKGDKAFGKSECLHAMKEHEKHEKAHGHKH